MAEQSIDLPLRLRRPPDDGETNDRNDNDAVSSFASSMEAIHVRSEGPSSTQSEQPQDSSKVQDSGNDDAPFACLASGFDQIFASSDTLDPKTYIRIYTHVHNMLTSMKEGETRSSRKRTARKTSENYSHLSGRDLYDFIKSYLVTHLSSVHADIVARTGDGDEDGLIPAYLEQWRAYTKAAKQSTHLLRFFDRHWVAREVDEGIKDILYMRPLHLALWKQEVLETGGETVLKTLREQIGERENAPEESVISELGEVREPFIVVEHPSKSDEVREVKNSFSTVGIKDNAADEHGEETAREISEETLEETSEDSERPAVTEEIRELRKLAIAMNADNARMDGERKTSGYEA